MAAPLHPAQPASPTSTPHSPRCAAAHDDDMTPCEGGRAVVRVVHQHGGEMTGCIHHAAALYAASVRSRVYASPGHKAALLEVHRRAQITQLVTPRPRIAS